VACDGIADEELSHVMRPQALNEAPFRCIWITEGIRLTATSEDKAIPFKREVEAHWRAYFLTKPVHT